MNYAAGWTYSHLSSTGWKINIADIFMACFTAKKVKIVPNERHHISELLKILKIRKIILLIDGCGTIANK